jgi:uncharacterized protein YbcC (UPF0753/DUF2309 family)
MQKNTDREFLNEKERPPNTLEDINGTETHLHHTNTAHKAHVSFDEQHILHELKHYLPTQTPLKDFIHHNTLHAFQGLKFYDAIFKASKIFGYQVTLQLSEYRELFKIGRIKKETLEKVILESKGQAQVKPWLDKLLSGKYNTSNYARIGSLRSHWKTAYKIDLDSQVQPILFRILCSYLDQGIAIWKFPVSEDGFLASVRDLEKDSFTSFFRTKLVKEMLQAGDHSIKSLLKLLVGDQSYFNQYLFDQQFSHQGWSGIASAIEDQPGSLLDAKKISIHDLVVFELLLELDAMFYHLGDKWTPLSTHVKKPGVDLFAPVPTDELTEVFSIWQNAFEWSYYDQVLKGIQITAKEKQNAVPATSFQAMFCIDERECSLRRHIESTDPSCETFGTPGFFSVEFFFKPENGNFYDKLCPQPVTPKFLIKEFDLKEKRKHDFLYTNKSHTFFSGFFLTLTLGFWSAVRLMANLFSPKMSPAISNAFAHMSNDSKLTIENFDPADRENDLQIGFTIDEMAARVESLLRGIGLTTGFAPLVYMIAHGSSSANNPHHGAHDCGACSGRPGSVNARVFAFMANHKSVRKLLAERGITIPATTQFLGGLHDTASDQIAFYDQQIILPENEQAHRKNKVAFETALDLNAKERSRRFSSIDTKMSLKKVRKAILDRSVSLFEPRPELGHGTNTLCIVGGRNLTKNLFLDRRAFLNSYNYKSDPEGKLLVGLMKPLGPVCGGINLEYYFSRVDNYKLGAGTKLPHNVMGLIGVANSSDGDLRPGLPVQMIEVHDPVRLLLVVEHFPSVVLKTIQSVPEMYEWFINEWVHLVAISPDTGDFYYFKEGSFSKHIPVDMSIDSIKDVNAFIESAKEMETNQITDATVENLPVYVLN